MALTISLRGVLNAPFRKRVRADAFPLNQYHSPLGKGTDVNICPFGVVWVAPFRQGRSVRYHSRWSFLMLLNSLDCILAIQCMTISGFQGCPQIKEYINVGTLCVSCNLTKQNCHTAEIQKRYNL